MRGPVAAVEVFAHAAGEDDLVGPRRVRQRRQQVARCSPTVGGGDDRVGHLRDRQRHVPRADRDRAGFLHNAGDAQCELRRPAADVDVQHRRAAFARACDGAGAMGREDRLQPMAGRRADEASALRGEELVDRARVRPFQRRAGEDDRSGVDLVRPKTRGVVREGDEALERIHLDQPIALEGRQQDRRAVDDLALDDDVAARERVREPLQPQAREHDVRGRRTDVDADRREDDVVRLKERLGPARR